VAEAEKNFFWKIALKWTRIRSGAFCETLNPELFTEDFLVYCEAILLKDVYCEVICLGLGTHLFVKICLDQETKVRYLFRSSS